jgi:hypothetical protein
MDMTASSDDDVIAIYKKLSGRWNWNRGWPDSYECIWTWRIHY